MELYWKVKLYATMQKVRFTGLVVCLIMFTQGVWGQQDAQFSQYMFNTLFYNPAFAGVEGVTKVQFVARTQWAGYASTFDGSGGNPNTQLISLTSPILKLRSGFGMYVVNDKLGPLNNIEAQASYSYHLAIKDAKLSIGIKAGIFSQVIDRDLYRPNVNPDPLIENSEDSQIRPDLGFGIYYRAEKYYAGISVNHILKSEFDFGYADSRNALEQHMTLTAVYDYELNYRLIITPSVLVKTDFNTYSFDLGAIATYNEKMWGGLAFRQSEAVIVLLGYSLLKDNSLKLGYSFDYVIKAQAAKEATSHEFVVSYTLPPVTAGGKKIIRTPRFRH